MSHTVYAIASGKGGVGKTTTTVNLGAMLADAGHDVVVVDTDLGMANVSGFLDFELGETTLHEVLAGEAAVEDAVYGAPGDIDVVPSNTDIEAFARSNTEKLRDVVAALREGYDFVLLDTGAGVSHDTILPLGLADGVILVSTPDVASLSDTAKTGQLTARVDGILTGAVLNKRSSNILNAADVESTLDTEVLSVVPEDDAVPMSIDAGRPLAAFAPNSPAAKAYRTLATVLTADDREAALEAADFDASPDPSGADWNDEFPPTDDADAVLSQPEGVESADEATDAGPFEDELFEDEPAPADDESHDTPPTEDDVEPVLTDAADAQFTETSDSEPAEMPDSELAEAVHEEPAETPHAEPSKTEHGGAEPVEAAHEGSPEPVHEESVELDNEDAEPTASEPETPELEAPESEPSEPETTNHDDPDPAVEADEPLIEEAEPRDESGDVETDAIPFGDPDAEGETVLAGATEDASDSEGEDEEDETTGLFGKLSGVFSR